MARKLILGSFLALILGVLVGMPILFQNVVFGERPRVYAEVVYAYFGLRPFSQNVSGLQGKNMISYLFVLNVTNFSDEIVEVTSLEATCAGAIVFLDFVNGTVSGTEPHSNAVWSNATEVRYENENGTGYGASDVIAARSESFRGSEYYWPENSSKLVTLSGMVEIPEFSLRALQSAKVFVFSHVEGKVYSSNLLISGAFVIKGIQLDVVEDREYVYNHLLSANETLHIRYDGTGVAIVTGN